MCDFILPAVLSVWWLTQSLLLPKMIQNVPQKMVQAAIFMSSLLNGVSRSNVVDHAIFVTSEVEA